MRNSFGKLHRLTVKGFRSIRAIEGLALDDINIVIGQNGAGKSNFVNLFRFLARLAREELQDYVVKQGGLAKILHFGPKVTNRLELYFQSDANEYEVALEPTNEGTLRSSRSRPYCCNQRRPRPSCSMNRNWDCTHLIGGRP